MKKKILWPIGILVFTLFLGCDKNDDTPIDEIIVEDPASVDDFPVQDFMWLAMNAYYFWQSDVLDLADDRFATQQDYADFLAAEPDPETFFYEICNNHEQIVGENAAVDRFSFLSENYKDLVEGFSGISKSNGVEFGLSLYGTGEDVFGFVRYIVPESDADGKDISRGDVFIGVNGTDLNLDNYIELLFGDNDTYTLNFATIVDNTITPNDRELSLTKEEGLVENPILINKVIEQGGIKIGYLLYNSFVADFDEELNEALGAFKAEGINELILDFRYNGGGRVSSAVQIASSIYGTKTDELFLKARYNEKIQATFGPGDGETNFFNETISGTPINDLNLQRVYVITSSSTASASELVINGLEPYVDVQQIGTTTVGKNEFSITFVDDPENGFFYDEDREANINPDNQWAIQPLLGRNENADGFSDYTAGLIPDIELQEDITNMGVLGNESEPLLALTLNTINGTITKVNFTPLYPVDLISSSLQFKTQNNRMLMDGMPLFKSK
ncbi:MAG: S41 family peptidase [Flavobacteriaceae bacterium]